MKRVAVPQQNIVGSDPIIVSVSDLHIDSTRVGRWDHDRHMHEDWWEAYSRLKDAVTHAVQVGATIFVTNGDLFQFGHPTAEAISLVKDALLPLEGSCICIHADGNHDQAGVVSLHRTALHAAFGGSPWHVVISEPSIVEAGDLELAVVPWVRVAGSSGLESAHVELRNTVDELKESLTKTSLFFGHLVVSEAGFSSGLRGSERVLTTNTLEAEIPAAELEDGPWGLVNLGHIHKRQWIGPKILYNGSMHKTDFGEAHEDKAFSEISWKGTTPVVKEIPLSGRGLYLVKYPLSKDPRKEVRTAQEGDIVRFVFEDDDGEDLTDLITELTENGVRVQQRKTRSRMFTESDQRPPGEMELLLQNPEKALETWFSWKGKASDPKDAARIMNLHRDLASDGQSLRDSNG